MANLDKKSVIEKYGKNEADTGSVEVQIALLTQRINHLNEHFKTNKLDKHSHTGLMKLVGRRKSLLRYLEKNNLEGYRELKAKLGLR